MPDYHACAGENLHNLVDASAVLGGVDVKTIEAAVIETSARPIAADMSIRAKLRTLTAHHHPQREASGPHRR